MKNIVFKNERRLLGKLESLAWKLWEFSFIRFVVVGGLNTFLGVLFTIGMRYVFDVVFDLDPKWVLLGFEGDWPVTLNYLCLFPIAYTTQALWSFRTSWSWARLGIYPLSTIPNYALNLLFTYLFESWLGFPFALAYALSAVLPIPIMYLIIKVMVVKPSSLK